MRTPSPATLVLLTSGVSVTRLAEALGVTPQAVSFHLAGKSAETSASLVEAIEDLADATTARNVARAIAAARAERRATG